MRRPGPLQELSLHLFTTDQPSNTSKSPVKRPHSPHAGDLLFSPSKRRILGEEGFFTKPSSPQRLSGSISTSSVYTPRKARITALQTESGEQPYTSSHDPRNAGSRHDLSTHNTTVLRSQPPHSLSSRRASRRSEMAMSERNCARGGIVEGVVTPRRSASSPNRQSIHYPGFDIYWDEHTATPAVDDLISQSNHATGSDGSKENVAPKRRVRKTDVLSKDSASGKSISRQRSKCGRDETRDSHEDTSKTPTQKSMRTGDRTLSQMLNSTSATISESSTLKSPSRRSVDILERRNLLKAEIEGIMGDY